MSGLKGTFRLHFRAPPDEHLTSVCVLGKGLSSSQALDCVEVLPSATQWFRDGEHALTIGEREVQGMSFFVDDAVQEREHESHKHGCTVKVSGEAPVSDCISVFKALLLNNDLAQLSGLTGVKLMDKSNKSRTEHRLEVWFAKHNAALSGELAKLLGQRLSSKAVVLTH